MTAVLGSLAAAAAVSAGGLWLLARSAPPDLPDTGMPRLIEAVLHPTRPRRHRGNHRRRRRSIRTGVVHPPARGVAPVAGRAIRSPSGRWPTVHPRGNHR